MLMTKKGLKLWGSGMIMIAMSVAFVFLMTEDVVGSISLTTLAIYGLVLFPLAAGWVQRWYWTRGTDDAVPEEE